MTAATALIPTHEHPQTLRHAATSVLEQSVQDLELFIVGDGVSDETRAVIAELAAADSRVRFFDFPKGPRMGEVHRHVALQEAKGRIVAYLGDDDCWMPNHLEVLGRLLSEADFAHTLHLSIDGNGRIVALPADLENPAVRGRMLTELFNCFGITCAGHTLAAYRRLPYGWRTTPQEFPWTDLYMWRQLLSQPWCRAKSAMIPTSINTWTHQRPHLSDRERADDLVQWRNQIAEPSFRETLWEEIARCFAYKILALEIEASRNTAMQRGIGTAHQRTKDRLVRSKIALTKLRYERDQARLEIRRIAAKRSDLSTALARIKDSVSWRVTKPLRYLRSLATALLNQPKKRTDKTPPQGQA